MNKLRQSLRRRKPAYVPEASRPHQWQADEDAVRKGTCSFPVRVSGRGAVRMRVQGAGRLGRSLVLGGRDIIILKELWSLSFRIEIKNQQTFSCTRKMLPEGCPA